MTKSTVSNPNASTHSAQQPVKAKTEKQTTMETASPSSTANTTQLTPPAEKKVTAKTSPVPANGDIAKDAFHGHWPDHIQAAKEHWNRLSHYELAQIGGMESKLTELVQQRYALAKDVASHQVKNFINQCNS